MKRKGEMVGGGGGGGERERENYAACTHYISAGNMTVIN